MFKFRYVLAILILFTFGSCVARKPEPPTTVVQLQQDSARAESETEEDSEEESANSEAEQETEMVAYQEYEADYLAALARASDLAEAEWNTFLRCRSSAVAISSQADADKNNSGIQGELIKRLRAVNTEAKDRAAGKRFYAHDAQGAADFRDPATDAIVLINLLQELQDGNPSFPLCTQDAGSLWRAVDAILSAADEMARAQPQSVPVEVPVDGEVAQDE